MTNYTTFKKQYRLAALLALTFFTAFSQAQQASLKYAKSIGGTDNDAVKVSTTDTSGNLYCAGTFMGTADLNPGSGNSNSTAVGAIDMFVSKLDKNGNLLWLKVFGSVNSEIPVAIKLDNSGNIHVAGYAPATLDFDLGSGTSKLPYNCDFVLKLDKDGNFSSLKPVVGFSIFDFSFDSNNNTYLAGTFSGNNKDMDLGSGEKLISSVAGSSDIFVIKYNSVGSFLWGKQFGGADNEQLKAISVSSNGVYLTGLFQGTADFDPSAGTKTLIASGHHDIFIAKLFTNGDFAWAHQIGSGSSNTSDEISTGLAVDAAGNSYIGGEFIDKMDFNPGKDTFEMTADGGDAFVLKLNNKGDFITAIKLGITNINEELTSLSIDKNNYITIAGIFNDSIDLNPGWEKDIQYSTETKTTYITILDTAFQYLGGFSFGSRFTVYDIHLNQNKQLFLTGFYLSTADVDPQPGVTKLTNLGAGDGFMLMYQFDYLSKNQTISKPVFNIYPNPITEQTCHINASQASVYSLMDLNGKTLQTGIIQRGENRIELPVLTPGIYLLRADSQTFKIIKN